MLLLFSAVATGSEIEVAEVIVDGFTAKGAVHIDHHLDLFDFAGCPVDTAHSPENTVFDIAFVKFAIIIVAGVDVESGFNRGTLFSVPIRNASARFDLHGTDIAFSDARATAEHGGNVSGEATISIPGFKQDNGSFQVKITGEKIALADLADVFKFDLGDKRGVLNGHVALSGPLSTNLTHRLGGEGQVSCTDGHLAQMRLFSGFTSYLAKYVPGIGSIVNLSNASLDFAITNGMLHASNAVIAGDVLAINAVGKYDIPGDDLDFSGNITLKKNEGMLMRLATTPIRWPFAKIFGFHLKGAIDNPTWSYEQNIISLPSALKK